jgi:hypothetical protein
MLCNAKLRYKALAIAIRQLLSAEADFQLWIRILQESLQVPLASGCVLSGMRHCAYLAP